MTDDVLLYTTEVCLRLRTVYGIACAVSFIFNMLTLLATISVTMGLNSLLGWSYFFFVASMLSLAVVLISALWMIFSKTVVIVATVLTGMFIMFALVLLVPGMMLAWHFSWGIRMELHIKQPGDHPSIVVKGSTGVHWCAYHGNRWHRWLLSVLLAAGEKPDPLAENADRWSPLMMAVYKDNLRMAKQLWEAGADMNRQDMQHGRTALHWAAFKGHTALAKALVEAGADASMHDAMGYTALELALHHGHKETAETIKQAMTELLNTALLVATQRKNHALMQRLLDAKASANCADMRKSTALHWAANRGDVEGAKILINAGADIHAKNEKGVTPLMEAATMGRVKIVDLLLRIDASSLDHGKGVPSYAQALQCACSWGHRGVVERLLGANQPVTKEAVDSAVRNNHEAVVKTLLGHMMYRSNCTHILHAAVMVGSNMAVKYILDKGWEGVNDGQRTTALILAAQEGHLDIVRTLLEPKYQVDVTKKDDVGRTALHWAAIGGNADIKAELLNAGAESNAVDLQGHTAAELARSKRHEGEPGQLLSGSSTKGNSAAAAAAGAEPRLPSPMPCSSV